MEKVIRELNIQEVYKEFVDSVLYEISDVFGSDMHSLYTCGSIPKGCATINKSDADFTVVCFESVDEKKKTELNKRLSLLLNKYSFVTKIDTTICTVDEILDDPYGWGVWIKIISYCIKGSDLGDLLPELVPNKKMIVQLNADSYERLTNIRKSLMECDDSQFIIRNYSKRLIRALFTLVLEDVGEWNDNLYVMVDEIKKHRNDQKELVERLVMYYEQELIDKEAFIELADICEEVLFTKLDEFKRLVK